MRLLMHSMSVVLLSFATSAQGQPISDAQPIGMQISFALNESSQSFQVAQCLGDNGQSGLGIAVTQNQAGKLENLRLDGLTFLRAESGGFVSSPILAITSQLKASSIWTTRGILEGGNVMSYGLIRHFYDITVASINLSLAIFEHDSGHEGQAIVSAADIETTSFACKFTKNN